MLPGSPIGQRQVEAVNEKIVAPSSIGGCKLSIFSARSFCLCCLVTDDFDGFDKPSRLALPITAFRVMSSPNRSAICLAECPDCHNFVSNSTLSTHQSTATAHPQFFLSVGFRRARFYAGLILKTIHNVGTKKELH